MGKNNNNKKINNESFLDEDKNLMVLRGREVKHIISKQYILNTDDQI